MCSLCDSDVEMCVLFKENHVKTNHVQERAAAHFTPRYEAAW